MGAILQMTFWSSVADREVLYLIKLIPTGLIGNLFAVVQVTD